MARKKISMYTVGTTWHSAGSSGQGAGNCYAPVVVTGASLSEADRLSMLSYWLSIESRQSETAGRHREAIVLRTKAIKLHDRALASLSPAALTRLQQDTSLPSLAPLADIQAASKPGLHRRLWEEMPTSQLLGEY